VPGPAHQGKPYNSVAGNGAQRQMETLVEQREAREVAVFEEGQSCCDRISWATESRCLSGSSASAIVSISIAVLKLRLARLGNVNPCDHGAIADRSQRCLPVEASKGIAPVSSSGHKTPRDWARQGSPGFRASATILARRSRRPVVSGKAGRW
jgi:hypothetical protein